MTEPLADRVIRAIDQAGELYHRLVILVAPGRRGKDRCAPGSSATARALR